MIIDVARPAKAGEILTLQRSAYVTEAQLYADPHLPPLTETLAELRDAIEHGGVLTARLGARVVGAVRGTVDADVCRIGRLVVAPDLQRRGFGATLLAAVESHFAGRVGSYALFTGERSEANLRLYRRAGYEVTHAEVVSERLTLIHLEKPAA